MSPPPGCRPRRRPRRHGRRPGPARARRRRRLRRSPPWRWDGSRGRSGRWRQAPGPAGSRPHSPRRWRPAPCGRRRRRAPPRPGRPGPPAPKGAASSRHGCRRSRGNGPARRSAGRRSAAHSCVGLRPRWRSRDGPGRGPEGRPGPRGWSPPRDAPARRCPAGPGPAPWPSRPRPRGWRRSRGRPRTPRGWKSHWPSAGGAPSVSGGSKP